MNLEELKSKAADGALVGAFPNIPAEVYHSFTNYLSATQIGAWKRSERHYAALLAGDSPDSDALEAGRVLHVAVGEPDKFEDEVAIGPEVNRNTTIWKNFVAQNPGKICWKPSEVEEVMQVAANVHAHPEVGGWFRGALVEWSFFAVCPTTGHPLKCRPDLISPDFKRMADLKSTKSAHPDDFPTDAFYLNYHIKMAHYLDVIELVTGVRPEKAIFIAAEMKNPYEVVPFVPDADEEFTIDILEVGAREARIARAQISERLKEKAAAEARGEVFKWNGYVKGFAPLCLPRHIARLEAQMRGAAV